MILVSGDWTQRARHSQYRQAEAFLRAIKVPVVSVPGNHDIPLYDFVTRFLRPLARYHEYIGRLAPSQYLDDELAIWGTRTPTRVKAVEGKLPKDEFSKVKDFFAKAGTRWKILLAHHPGPLNELKPLGVQLILTGHYHRQSVVREQGVLEIAAGSGTSSRLRGESNGFHMITLEGKAVSVRTYLLDEDGFLQHETDKVFT